jgi:hypothetical protein
MKRSLGQLFHLGAGTSTAAVGAAEVQVRLHFLDDSATEDVDNFNVGSGISFFLTFIGGGTVPIDLTDVKEIRFIGLADCRKGLDAGIPVYQVKVWLGNGRVLEGFSADLHSFSGRRSGRDWKCSLKSEIPERPGSGRQLFRILIRDFRHSGSATSVGA